MASRMVVLSRVCAELAQAMPNSTPRALSAWNVFEHAPPEQQQLIVSHSSALRSFTKAQRILTLRDASDGSAPFPASARLLVLSGTTFCPLRAHTHSTPRRRAFERVHARVASGVPYRACACHMLATLSARVHPEQCTVVDQSQGKYSVCLRFPGTRRALIRACRAHQ